MIAVLTRVKGICEEMNERGQEEKKHREGEEKRGEDTYSSFAAALALYSSPPYRP